MSVTPLSYAPARPPLWRRKASRRVAWLVPVIGIVVAAMRYGSELMTVANFAYIQYACAHYSPSASQVVYEEEPARSATLRSRDPNARTLSLLLISVFWFLTSGFWFPIGFPSFTRFLVLISHHRRTLRRTHE